MNTQTTPENSPEVVDLLESAREDLEHFRNELGHEEAEVHSKYEELKREIKKAVHQMKEMVRNNKTLSSDVAVGLRQRFSLLEEQVSAPRQESDSAIITQLTSIKRVMEDIVRYLGDVSVYDLSLVRIQDRIYRYKIKFGIIKLKLQLGSMQMKDIVLDARYDLKSKIHDLREYMKQSEDGLERRWNLFHREISEAYEHLQKAFTAK